MNPALVKVKKVLEDARNCVEDAKNDLQAEHWKDADFDNLLDIEMDLEWTLKRFELFAERVSADESRSACMAQAIDY